jgi:hypothetical protein
MGGIHMILLVLFLYVLTLSYLYITLSQWARVKALQHYRTYDRRVRAQMVKAAKIKLAWLVVQLALLIIAMLTVIGSYHGSL